MEPSVCIDGRPAFGVEELGGYRPDELYLLEVYNRGATIQAFTYRYMERVGRTRGWYRAVSGHAQGAPAGDPPRRGAGAGSWACPAGLPPRNAARGRR